MSGGFDNSSGGAAGGARGEFGTKLAVALVKAKNFEVIAQVVDDSLKRAEELRKLREKSDAEKHELERVERRARENERLEKKSAEQLSTQQQAQSLEIASREAEKRAQNNALLLEAQTRPAENGWTGELSRNLTPISLSA